MTSDPNVAVLWMLAGALAIYVELVRPGLVIAGVTGGVALLVGLASLVHAPLHELRLWLLAVVVPFALLSAWLARIAIAARRGKRLR